MAKLTSLSIKELKVVGSEVERLVNEKQGVDIQLYQTMCLMLGVNLPYSRFSSTAYAKTFLKNQKLVREFIDRNSTGLSPSELKQFQFLIITAMYDYLVDHKLPLTVGSMVNNLGNVESIFNEAFPGWIENGLVHLLIKRR